MLLSSVLAQMWDNDNHMDNGWWWVMGIAGTSQEILDERFARGEIDEQEYGSRREALGG